MNVHHLIEQNQGASILICFQYSLLSHTHMLERATQVSSSSSSLSSITGASVHNFIFHMSPANSTLIYFFLDLFFALHVATSCMYIIYFFSLLFKLSKHAVRSTVGYLFRVLTVGSSTVYWSRCSSTVLPLDRYTNGECHY